MERQVLHLVLTGSIRAKKNSRKLIRLKTGRVLSIPSTAYVKWEKEVRKSVLWQTAGRVPSWAWTSKLHVKATIYFKGARPDLSGALESIGDCLENLIWKNDAQIESWDGSRLIHDLENPQTILEVTPYDT